MGPFTLESWQIFAIGALFLATPLVASAVFALWLKRQPGVTLESGARSWEAFVKLISAVTVIAGGVMLFAQYTAQQRNAVLYEVVKADLRETETKYAQQWKLLREARTIAARIASTLEYDQQTRQDRTRFDELYYADLIGVEGPKVIDAMINFRLKLTDPNNAEVANSTLKSLSLDLSNAVQDELQEADKKLKALRARVAQLSGLAQAR